MKRLLVNIIVSLCCIFTCSKVSAQGHWAYNANDYRAENGREFNGWTEEIPATMPASDLAIHGTTSVVTGISNLVGESNGKVDVYNISGVLVCKDADMEKIGQLPDGLYVIRGKKVVLKK